MHHTSVAEWLASIGLAQYAAAFAEQEIDFTVLGDLDDAGLKELGVSLLGHRLKLLRAIAELIREPAAAATAPDAPAQEPAAARAATAERRHLTVMFCDLVGSMALAARLDPEDMREVVRDYQSACAQVIARYDGFVAQYLGDGVMAYFGYPAAHEDDAERAVRAGLDLVAAVATLDTATKVEVRVGIATGLVVVGDLIGEHAAKERAVTGETPNLAARLQGLAAPGSIVVGPTTRRLLGGQFELRDLGAQQVKGLDAPVQAFAVEGMRSFESRFEARAGGLTGFVGREEECEHLLDRWKLARQGRGQVVLVSGEAGIGKSRLTAWLVDKVAGEPHTRMRYQCTPHHKDSALYPTIAQIERAAGIVRADPGEAKLAKLEALLTLAETEAAETVPLFAALLAIPTKERYPPLAISPRQQRQRTLAMLLDHVEALARQKPLLMIYEDTHWADATSLELLDTLVDRVARLPVLFAVTGRPEFSPAWAGRHNVSTITLQKLDKRHTRAMVKRVTGGAALPLDVLEQIVAKTDGVPLFVEELTKTVLESGALVEERGRLRAATALPIPATLQDSLMARLDRSNPVKEIAQIGAAIGREFSYELLLAVAGRDEASVRVALAGLEELELASRRGMPPDATYTFKHALVQDAAYESLLKSRVQGIHRRIAKTMRDKFPDLAQTQPEVVAHHFARAKRIEQAIDWWCRAGALAYRRSAFVEAMSNYEEAIGLGEAFADNAARRPLRLHVQVSYANAVAGSIGPGAHVTSAAFARAVAISDPSDDPADRFGAQWGLWVGHFARGEADSAYAVARDLLQAAEREGVASISLRGQVIVGATEWLQGEYTAAIARLLNFEDKDVPHLFQFSEDYKAGALRYLAFCRWVTGDVQLVRALVDQTDEYVLRLGHIGTLASTFLLLSALEAVRNDVMRTSERAHHLLAVAREHDMPVYTALCWIFLGWTRWRDGDRVEGEDTIREGRAFFARQGREHFIDPLFATLWAEVRAGEHPQDALTILDETIAKTTASGVRWFDAELHRRRARIALRLPTPRREEAEAALGQALFFSRTKKARTFELRASLDLARLYCDTGREREAAPLLQGALLGFTETPELPEIGEARQLLSSLVPEA